MHNIHKGRLTRGLVLITCVLVLTCVSSWAQPDDFCYNCTGTTGDCAFPSVSSNPELVAPCPTLEILFILDNSGSISGFQSKVEEAVLGFLNSLNGTGPSMSIIEFDSEATLINDYEVIDDDYITDIETYFNTYIPIGFTNWQDALDLATEIDTPDLVIFFTDGSPTVYSDSTGAHVLCAAEPNAQRPDIVNPMKLANYFKDSLGVHIFGLGVGNSISTTNLERITGSLPFQSGVNTIATSDYFVSPTFSALAEDLRQFALQLCGSDLSLDIATVADTLCSNEEPVFRFQIINDQPENKAVGVIMRDTLPSSLSGIQCVTNCGNVCVATECDPDEPVNVLVWEVDEILPGDTAELIIKASTTLAGQATNTAWISAINDDPEFGSADIMVYSAPEVDLGPDKSICRGLSSSLVPQVLSGNPPFKYTWSTGDTTASLSVSPEFTTEYYVSVLDVQGCVSVDTIIVNVAEVVNAEISAIESDICVGGMTDLSVTQTGGFPPYSYAWSTGSSTDQISVAPLTATSYIVTVTDSAGCLDVDSIAVTVTDDPTVQASADGDEICSGGTTVLRGSASGGVGGTSYQWQLKTLGVWDDIPSANADTFLTPSLSTGTYLYRLRVERNSGCKASSDSLVVNVVDNAIVSLSQSSVEFCVGGQADLTATIVGGTQDLSLQWESSSNGIDGWVPAVGDTSMTLQIEGDQSGTTYYRVVTSDDKSGCINVTSSISSVEVFDSLSVSVSSDQEQYCLGATITIDASIVGGTNGKSLSWSVSNDSAVWTAVPDITSSINYDPVSAGAKYFRLLVIDTASGCISNAEFVKRVDVFADPQVSLSSDVFDGCLGNDIVLSASIEGGTSVAFLQWQQSTDGISGWSDIAGATNEVYATPASDTGNYFFRARVIDAGQGCGTDTSTTIQARIELPPLVDLIASATEVCLGDSTVVSAIPSRGFGGYNYVWSTGATTPTITVTPSDTASYSVTLTDAAGCDATGEVTLNFNDTPQLDLSVDRIEICEGGVANMSATIIDSVGVVQYQWETRNGPVWDPVTGANDRYYSAIGLLEGEYDFRVRASSSGACEVISDTLKVSVRAGVQLAATSNDIQFCIGGEEEILIQVTGGSDSISFQWEESPNGVDNWTQVSGADSVALSVMGNSIGQTWYRLSANDPAGGCPSVISDVVSVRVFDSLSGSVDTGGDQACVGGTVIVTADLDGGTARKQYQWSTSTDSLNWVALPDTTTSVSFDANSVETRYFRVGVTDPGNGCIAFAEFVKRLDVVSDPEVSVLASSVNSCLGSPIFLNAEITGGTAQAFVQWQESASGSGPWANIEGATEDSLIVSQSDTGVYYFRALVIDSSIGCDTAFGATTSVRFDFEPQTSIIAGATEACIGDVIELITTPEFGFGEYTFEWSNGEEDSIIYVSPADTTSYTVTVTDDAGCSTAAAIMININDFPVLSVNTNDEEMCDGGQAELLANVGGYAGDVDFQWEVFSGGWNAIVGADSALYVTPALSPGTYRYRCVTSASGACRIESDEVEIEVRPDPVMDLTAADNSVCVGAVLDLQAQVAGGSSRGFIKWERSEDGLSNWVLLESDSSELFSVNTDTAGVHFFRATVEDSLAGCQSVQSEVLRIDVLNDIALSFETAEVQACVNGLAELNVATLGGTSTLTYQWFASADSTSWTELPGETQGQLLVEANAVGQTFFRVQASDISLGCGLPEPAYVKLVVNEEIAASAGAQAGEACLGEPVDLVATISGGSAIKNVKWQRTLDTNSTWSDVMGAWTDTLSVIESDSGVFYYRVAIVDTAFGCVSVETAPIALKVYRQLIVDIVTDDTEVCLNDVVTLTADRTFGSGQFNYQWQRFESPTWIDIVGANGDTYQPNTSSIDTNDYRVVVQDSVLGCDETISGTFEIRVIEPVSATMSFIDPSCGRDNGSILITLQDSPTRDFVEVSTNGGLSWSGTYQDNVGTIELNGFAPAAYDVRIRWAGGECPVDLGTASLINRDCGTICGSVVDMVYGPLDSVELRLFHDQDSNGVADAELVAVTLTDLSGDYCFDSVVVGNYVVVQTQPIEYIDVYDYDTSTGPSDPDGLDSLGGPDNDIPVSVAAFELDSDNDFVEVPSEGDIEGYTYNDEDDGMSGVLISLYADTDGDGRADGSVLETVLTDQNGFFNFTDLETGDYVLVQSQPLFHSSLSDIDETNDGDGDDSADGPDNDIPVVLGPGEVDDGNIFREGRTGQIRGSVKTQNGVGLPGVQIRLFRDTIGDGTPNGVLVNSTTTNVFGLYAFAFVPAGDYAVVEIQSSVYTDVSDYDVSTGPSDPDGDDSADGPDNEIPVTLAPNETDEGNDFVDLAPGSICGSVITDQGRPIGFVKIWLFADVNGDGAADGTPIDSVFSDGDSGSWCFEDIPVGNYVVVEEHPNNYTSVSDFDIPEPGDTDGDDSAQGPDDDIPVVLNAGEEDEGNDFIEDPFPGDISGEVVDEQGGPLSDVLILLYFDENYDQMPDGAVLDSARTNLSGSFAFTFLEPTGYLLVEEQPANYTSISDFDQTPDGDGNDNDLGANDLIPVILYAGETDDGNIFTEGRPGTICGNVRDDRGVPLPGVTIRLYADLDSNEIPDGPEVASIMSDPANGNYCFENILPSRYVLVQDQPDEYVSVSDYDTSVDSLDTDGFDGAIPDNDIPVVLAPGESDTGNDFVEDPNQGSITGSVVNDVDLGISSIKVWLYPDFNADGIIDGPAVDSVLTDGLGAFAFEDLDPNAFVLVGDQPFLHSSISDFDQTPDPDGDDSAEGANNEIPVVLIAGETDEDNVFKEGRPGEICGYVITDRGRPVGNVLIYLYADINGDGNADAGAPLDSVYSDPDSGDFCFSDQEPGDYVLVEQQPGQYSSVDDYDHTIDGLDPDGDDREDGADNDIPVTLSPAEEDDNNIFTEDAFTGEITGGVRDENGTPIPNVVINLFEDFNSDGEPDGAAIAQATTNLLGVYNFTGVEPDPYIVRQTQPDNYSSISDFDETPDGDGNDNALGANNEIPVIILPGEVDDGNNFVEGSPGSICGNVRDDLGNPIGNIEIALYVDSTGSEIPVGSPVAVVLTDSLNGNFCFDSLTPLTYLIVQSQPANYVSVLDHDLTIDASDPDGDDSGDGPDDNIPVVLSPGESDTGNDFVENPDPAFITGSVKDDRDLAMIGVKIYLWNDFDGDGIEDGSPIDSLNTDLSGEFSFDSLYPGNYILTEEQPAFFGNIYDQDLTPDPDGDDSADGPDDQIPVRLVAAEVDADNSFVNSRPGSICGKIIDDLNRPVPVVEIRLYMDANLDTIPDGVAIDTVFSDPDGGDYCFEPVVPGGYILEEIQPGNYGESYDFDSSPDPDGDDSALGSNNIIPVFLEPAEEDDDNDFGDIACPTIPEIIGGDSLIACAGSVVVFETESQNLLTETYAWTFGVGATPQSADGPGPHYVVYDTNQINQSVGAEVTLTVQKSGCGDALIVNGNVLVRTSPEAQINGPEGAICWYDQQVLSAGGTNLPGTIYEWDFGPGAVFESTSGPGPHTVYYTSQGSKTVQLITRNEHSDLSCSDTAQLQVNVNAAGCLGNIAGNVTSTNGNPIGNVLILLYSDDDLDGQPDDPEVFEEFTFTTDQGTYAFVNLTPGNYVVSQLDPEGYTSVEDMDASPDVDSVPNINTNDNLIPVTVQPATSDFDNNFIEFINPGSIEGYVFDDIDASEMPDPGEGIGGVWVELYSDPLDTGIPTGVPIDSALTDTSGRFFFDTVEPGEYVLREVQPQDVITIKDIDASEDVDEVVNAESDDDYIPVTITPGEADIDNHFVNKTFAYNVVVNTLNDGPGSLRGVSANVLQGDTIFFASHLAGDTISLTTDQIMYEKSVVIYGEHSPRVTVLSTGSRLFEIGAGHSIEISDLILVGGLSGEPTAIKNEGELKLRDIVVWPNQLYMGDQPLISNTGSLIISGEVEIKK